MANNQEQGTNRPTNANKPKLPMKTIAVIPARMGSSRFPGKPLAKLLGRTMLEHIYKRVTLSNALDATYIATCDEEIRQAAQSFGAAVIMTADTHERASDRVAEAVAGIDAELIVMVQGDEPMTHPEMIDAAVAPFRDDPQLGCVNLVRRIENEVDFYDVNTIKVVLNQQGDALYMSRQPIPTLAKSGFTRPWLTNRYVSSRSGVPPCSTTPTCRRRRWNGWSRWTCCDCWNMATG